MVFQRRAVFRQFKHFHGFIQENHTMRIAHRYGRQLERAPQNRDRRSFHHTASQQARHILAGQNRRAHIHADGLRLSIFHGQVERLHAGIGFQRHHRFVRHAAVVYVFRDASTCVAAHRSARTIRVVHNHAEIRLVARRDEHQPVAAHAEMPVAHAPRQRRQIVCLLFKRVDIDVVVAQSLHFGEFHECCFPASAMN